MDGHSPNRLNSDDVSPTKRAGQPAENDGPEAFAGRDDARFSAYCRALARELGASPGKAMMEVSDIIRKRYAKTRIKHLFGPAGLTAAQFEDVLEEAGGDKRWRGLIEDQIGMTFQQVYCPLNALAAGGRHLSFVEGAGSSAACVGGI
jgi:hypothetical protein